VSVQSSDSYAKLKLAHWNAYSAAISPWEREQTLDC
jgi:glutamine synthetase